MYVPFPVQGGAEGSGGSVARRAEKQEGGEKCRFPGLIERLAECRGGQYMCLVV